MKWVVCLFILFSESLWAEPIVRVRLKKDVKNLRLRGSQVHFVFRPALRGAGQLLREEFSIVHQKMGQQSLWTITDVKTGESRGFTGDRLKIFGHQLLVNSLLVPPQLELVAKSDRQIDVIAELPLETYLKGVLPAEVPASWPIEALKAQAIASRSYALAVMKENQGHHFHLESTIYDQVYDLESHSIVKASIKRKIHRALSETRGMYLQKNNEKGAYKAFYHADCGGHTEEPYLVWGENGINGTVADKYCPNSPNGKWRQQIAVSRLSRKLKRFFDLPEEALFQGLRITQRSSSGRVLLLSANFARGEFLLSAQNLRQLMGYKRIKSTNFKLYWKNKWLTVEGKGFGHGVGLCQWGSKHLAHRGAKYPKIIKHYYPKTQIVRLKENQKTMDQKMKTIKL